MALTLFLIMRLIDLDLHGLHKSVRLVFIQFCIDNPALATLAWTFIRGIKFQHELLSGAFAHVR